MQVKVLPAATEVDPAVLHFAPALTAAFAGIDALDVKRAIIDMDVITFLLMGRP